MQQVLHEAAPPLAIKIIFGVRRAKPRIELDLHGILSMNYEGVRM